jgi:hypothetical protein
MTLELTLQEAQVLLQLLDIAVKAGGLQNAKAALPISDRLIEAINIHANPDAQPRS